MPAANTRTTIPNMKRKKTVRHDGDADVVYDQTMMAQLLDDEEADGSWELPKIALTLELKEALKRGASRQELRFVLDTLYQRQKARIRIGNQVKARAKGADSQGRAMMLEWLLKHDKAMEEQIKAALHIFVRTHPMFGWLSSIVGVGPLISAGLVTYLDINNPSVKSAGSFWSFAGQNPEAKWLEGTPRPWCAALKCLCYKLGESFVKQQGREGAFYADHFTKRKADEVRWNDEGKNAAWATTEAMDGKYKKAAEAWSWVNACYPAGTSTRLQEIADEAADEFEREIIRDGLVFAKSADKAKALSERIQTARSAHLSAVMLPPGQGLPMLPPAHVHARARRWVVKMFLSHMFDVWYELEKGVRPPDPWVIVHGGHVHVIDPPREDLKRKKVA